VLRPAEALLYRSRVAGREIEIVWLAPEGQRVQQNDPVIRLDTTELALDLEHATQAVRQAQLDLQVAEAEFQVAGTTLSSVSAAKGSVENDEAQFNLRVAEIKVEQLKKDYESLVPLLDKGFVTREELARAALESEQAAATLEIARRRAAIIAEQKIPQERQRAALDVAQRTNQRAATEQKLLEASNRVRQLRESIDSCTIRAQHAGLVVYEENLASSPRRKVRVGDRVTPSQGLITIPEVARMLADTSLREADLHRVHPGQAAFVTLEAYPDARLSGRVVSVGTVARLAPDRPADGKRFDVVVDVDPSQLDLRPEMTARVEMRVADLDQAIVVPINAVVTSRDGAVVFVVSSGRVEKRAVVLGSSNDVLVEVRSGVKEGERVRLLDAALVEEASGASGGREAGARP